MGDILFLAHRVPWPPNRGDKIRSHHILRQLLECAPVHMACFADDAAEAAEPCELEHRLSSRKIAVRAKPQWQAGVEALISGKPVSLTSFYSATIQDYVDATLARENIDCIFVFSGQMAQYVPVDYSGRLVMDFVDVDSAKFESYGAEGMGPMAWVNRREGRLLSAFEKDVSLRADHSLFVSEAEVQLFKDRSNLQCDGILPLGNGIDLGFYDPESTPKLENTPSGPMILFTGQMDYRPNIQAVTSFSRAVMPAILEKYPTAQFVIAGRAPTSDVRKLDGTNHTIVTGAVDDIRSWLQAADIVVAPLRIARGIQNKVLEAMAMGKPVVASVAAAQGIDAVDGRDFWIAENEAQEAQMVVELLSDTQTSLALGYAAMMRVHSRYSWQEQLAILPELCGFSADAMVEAAE